VAIFPFTLAL